MQFENAYTPRSLCPSVTLTPLSIQKGVAFAVREDLLPGGTKQRAILPFLNALREQGFRHFVYASPFAGFAQVALAYVCQSLGLECTLVAERDPATGEMHEFTALAQSYGARVFLESSLESAERKAHRFTLKEENAFKIPLGFNDEMYRFAMRRELERSWSEVLFLLGRVKPKNLWLPVGSGVLTSVFSQVVDPSVRFRCLNVHVLEESDSRIQTLMKNPRVDLISCPLRFESRALQLPEIPSNIHYDAKLWEIIERDAEDGDVWWNVAR